LGKIVSGGMPGAVLVGKESVMQVLDAPLDPRQHVIHGGTFNANPLAAAAGIATLDIVADGEPQKQADAIAATLRGSLNELFQKERIAGCVYGESSTFHTFFGNCPPREADDDPMWTYDPQILSAPADRANTVHKVLQAHGVDLMSSMSGMTSCEHSDADIERTVDAYAAVIPDLLERGVIQRRT
jgi:glutamate-1-semialdehyde 2,1-aminomutase